MGPGGGQSHSGGDAYVRVKRPPFSASLAPIDPIFFYSCMSSHPKTHIFAFNLSLKAPWFEKLACEKIQFTLVILQSSIEKTNQKRPYFFVIFLLSPDDPTYFCIFLSLNAKNHALTQWPLIFWACALTECPSLSERGIYTRIHFIFDCLPRAVGFLWVNDTDMS